MRRFAMDPSRVEYDLGGNAFGQPVKLIQHRSSGKDCFRLERGPADQRDDSSFVDGLTAAQLAMLAELVG